MRRVLEIDVKNLGYGLEIIQQITDFKPYSSHSFQLSPKGFDAVGEVKQLAEWGMGNNMYKMKEAALEILESILACSPEEWVNMNLTDYESKSLGAVEKLIERSLKKQEDGILRK
jgi:hypothetical protein